MTIVEKIAEQLEKQRRLNAFAEQEFPEFELNSSMTLMCQPIHCWPYFPVIDYLAMTTFKITPNELSQMCSVQLSDSQVSAFEDREEG